MLAITSCSSERVVALGCGLCEFLCTLTQWLYTLTSLLYYQQSGRRRRLGRHFGIAASAAFSGIVPAAAGIQAAHTHPNTHGGRLKLGLICPLDVLPWWKV